MSTVVALYSRTDMGHSWAGRTVRAAVLLTATACGSALPTSPVGTEAASAIPVPSAAPTQAGEGSTDEPAAAAVRIVRSDPRADDFLSRNPFRTDLVVIEGDRLHLLLTFDGPISGPPFWDETCDADFTSGPISGAHFVIDVPAASVIAFSPRWGGESCAGPAPTVEWREPAEYSFTLESECGHRDLIGRYHIEVANGLVRDVRGLDEPGRRFVASRSSEGGVAGEVPTLADLLGLVAEARSNGAAVVVLRTDPTDGRPMFIEIDRVVEMTDDEECYTISDFDLAE